MQKLYKHITREQLTAICEKYGKVETLTIKTQIEAGKVSSRGIAIVQYSTKEEASEALKKLPFHDELSPLLDIDFY